MFFHITLLLAFGLLYIFSLQNPWTVLDCSFQKFARIVVFGKPPKTDVQRGQKRV